MYTLSSNVLSSTLYDAATLDNALLGGLKGFASDFITLEKNTGINAVFAAAHAAIESGWGTSVLAHTKNNLFGIAAYDSNPNDAYEFQSVEDCVAYYGIFLKANYLTPGGVYYLGPTIHDVFVHYSTSGDKEALEVTGVMNQIIGSIAAKPTVNVLSGEPFTTYTVKPGDTLSLIAYNYGIADWTTLYNFDGNRARIGDNPNFLQIGLSIHIPEGKVFKPAVSSGVTYTVEPGESLWEIAAKTLGSGTDWQEIATLNKIAGPKYVIYPGQILHMP